MNMYPDPCLTQRNILLAQKGTVAKVSDFGLSHSLYASVEELNNTSAGLPVRWMAPEVLMNRQVSSKWDCDLNLTRSLR